MAKYCLFYEEEKTVHVIFCAFMYAARITVHRKNVTNVCSPSYFGYFDVQL